MATILEKLQEKYPGVTDDARNIAEAVAAINGVGGRGANAIADQFPAIEEETESTEPGDSLLDPEPSEP